RLRRWKRTGHRPPARLPELTADAGLRRERVPVLALRMSYPRLAARLRLARAAKRCGQNRPAQEQRWLPVHRRLRGWGRCQLRRLLGGWLGSWELISLS